MYDINLGGHLPRYEKGNSIGFLQLFTKVFSNPSKIGSICRVLCHDYFDYKTV
jgi:hypothetical protein